MFFFSLSPLSWPDPLNSFHLFYIIFDVEVRSWFVLREQKREAACSIRIFIMYHVTVTHAVASGCPLACQRDSLRLLLFFFWGGDYFTDVRQPNQKRQSSNWLTDQRRIAICCRHACQTEAGAETQIMSLSVTVVDFFLAEEERRLHKQKKENKQKKLNNAFVFPWGSSEKLTSERTMTFFLIVHDFLFVLYCYIRNNVSTGRKKKCIKLCS